MLQKIKNIYNSDAAQGLIDMGLTFYQFIGAVLLSFIILGYITGFITFNIG